VNVQDYIRFYFRLLLELSVIVSPALPGVVVLYFAFHMCGTLRKVWMAFGWAMLLVAAAVIVVVGWPSFWAGNPYYLF
jgi:hypothetical protein